MADGFVLNVDAKFLQDLEKADKRMSDLVDKSNSLSTSVVNAFNKISTQGVDPFLEKLRQQKNALEAIASIDLGSKPTSEMRKLVKSASDAVDEINRVINALQGASTQMDVNRAAKSVDSEIKKETDSYLENLDEQIQERQKYLLRQEEIEQKRVKISQDAEKQVEKEIKKETDAYLKDLEKRIKGEQEYEQRMIALEESRVRAQKQQLTDYANYELNQLSESLAKHKSYGSQLLANDAHYHNQRQAMYEKLFSLQAKYQAEAGALLGRVYARTGGESWNIQGEDVIKQNQADLKSRRDYINERTRMYEQMFDEISRREKQAVDDFRNYEKSRLDDSLEQYKRNKQDQANVDKHYHNQRQREYDEMFAKIDELAKRESVMRSKAFSSIQSHGDTSKQAEAAYNRLYGDKGVKSINNMNRALQRLQNAQNKLNLNTDKGRQKYDELGKKIQQIKKDLDKATQANEKFHNSHSKLLNTTDQLQRKLALLFSVSAIQGYMDKLVNVRKEFELQQKSLQVLLRDKDQADKLWQQTIDLAVKSPFRVSQLVNYTKQLAAYRIESDKLYDTTKMLSDVSAGLGVDMQRIILAFGQVRAANFLRGTELRQFTEAGIPMLDELAEMFTEIEGRVVSAGDVFERISKRMVVFRDVEEVFKRMTSENGVFYNMQEEQSKTLFGMISNLHDSIDLMLNDIGRSNDGIIKDMVSLTRDLVENWRGVATVLKQVGVTIAMIGLTKFATGWKIASAAITTGSVSSALAMNGMAGSAARLRIAMSTLGKTISANPWFLLVGALASAGHALWEYVESINAANAKYDDMSRREITRIDQLEELQKKTEQYNAIIEDGNASEQARNKAQLENDKILSQIKAKYPELYPLIVQQENKTIDLTKAIERQNKVLDVNIALQQRAKGGFFQEDFSENYKDALKSQDALKSSLVSLQSEASQASAKLKMLSVNGDIPKNIADNFDKILKYIRKSKTFDEAKKYIYEFNDAFQKIGSDTNLRIPLFDVFNDIRNKFSELNNEQINYANSLSRWGANLDNQMDAFRIGIEDAMKGLSSDEANKKATQWANQQLDALGVVDKELKKWAQQYIVRETGIKLTFVDEGKKVYTESDLTKEWQKKIWGAIKKVESTNPDIRLGVTLEDVATQDLATLAKTLNESVENAIKENKNVIDVGKITEQIRFTPQQIKNAEDSVKPLQMLADVIGLIIKQTSDNKGKDWMSEVVKGIKEAHQEYIKLNKTLGESESKQLALNKYAKSFAESAKNAGLKDISLGQFKFETEEGAIEALTFLKNKLPQSAEQARFKLEEAIGEIRGEVRIRTKAEDDKLLIEQIEDMFSGYEMSIELKKLNIPKDLAKQLFNVDSLTLPELKSSIFDEFAKNAKIGASKLIEAFNKAEETGNFESLYATLGKDMTEKLKDSLKEIQDLEDKQQVERLKKYTKYLLKAQSERVKIKMEELRQIAEIEKENAYTDSQKETIKRNLQIETQEKIDKQAWDDFKNSEMYTQMFSDLEHLGTESIKRLKNSLELLKESLSELPASDLKEIMQQISKLEELEIERNPFASMRDAMKEVDELKKKGRTEKFVQEELATTQARIDSSKAEVDAINVVLNARKEGLSLETQSAEWQDNYRHLIMASNEELQNRLNYLERSVEKDKKIAQQAGIDAEAYVKARKATKGFTDNVAKWGEAIKGVLGGVDEILDAFGVAEDDTARLWVNNAMQIADMIVQVVILTASLHAMGVAANSALGVVGWVAMALQGVAMIFASIFGMGDKKKERQIERELHLVKQLERAYDDLNRVVEKGYSIEFYRTSANRIDALKKQQEAYERMIAAERAKKKTDEDRINDWLETIRDLNNEIEDAYDELREELIGDFKDYSDQLADAMIDALKAGEDGIEAWGQKVDEIIEDIVQKLLVAKFLEPKISGLIDQYYADIMPKTSTAEKARDRYEKLYEEYLNAVEDVNNFDIGSKGLKEYLIASSKIKKMEQQLEAYQTEYEKALSESKGEIPEIDKAATDKFEQGLMDAGEWFQSILPDWFTNKLEQSELSGLQRGIQGVTEETAQIIEAYMASVRFYVADSNSKLAQLVDQFVGGENTPNPILSELRTQTELVRGISTLLNSVVRGSHSMGGQGIKVFIS